MAVPVVCPSGRATAQRLGVFDDDESGVLAPVRNGRAGAFCVLIPGIVPAFGAEFVAGVRHC